MNLSVLQRASAADIIETPFPHLLIEQALPPPMFAEMQSSYPSLQQVSQETGPFPNNQPYLASAHTVVDGQYPAIWRDFFAFHVSPAFNAEVARVWGPAIRNTYPGVPPLDGLNIGTRTDKQSARKHDLVYDCQFVVNSPVKETSSVRTPHVDSTHTLVAGILYFRSPDDDTPGGDLELYEIASAHPTFDGKRFIDARHLRRFRTVPYAANTLVMWLNTPRSVHGVSPRSPTPLTRQFVNFIAESYSFAPSGFFSLPMHRPSILNRAVAGIRRRLGQII